MTGGKPEPDAAMGRFLQQAAGIFARHDSAIGTALAGALAEAAPEGMTPRTGGETIPDLALDTATEPARSLAACLPLLHWRRSGQGKLPAGIAAHLRTAEIIGPDGMMAHERIRFGVLYQGAALRYPEHRHAAEELYFIVSGQALWSIDKGAPLAQEAGCFVHHRAWQWHAMQTSAAPMLALWGWAGQIGYESYGLDETAGTDG